MGEGEGGKVAESRSGRKELERKENVGNLDMPRETQPVLSCHRDNWRGESWRKERVADTLIPHPSSVVFSFVYLLSTR